MKVVKKKNELAVDNILEDKEYKVLLIEYFKEDGLYRIINENNEPVLYPSIAFNITDNTLDKDWKVSPFDEKYYNDDIHYGNGIRYIGPQEFFYNYHFFKDWFNNKEKERKILSDFLEKNPEYLPNKDKENIFNDLKKVLNKHINHDVIIEWKDHLKAKVKVISFYLDDNLCDEILDNGVIIEISKDHKDYKEWTVISFSLYEFLYIPKEITSFKNMNKTNINKFGGLEVTSINIPKKVSLLNNEIIWDLDLYQVSI